jgi:hypothetical protein
VVQQTTWARARVPAASIRSQTSRPLDLGPLRRRAARLLVRLFGATALIIGPITLGERAGTSRANEETGVR